ncbi:hypothetical protein JK635_12935 [Neobacillus sp. YIM B02564]|uniref:Uncharacterized protein n=1 Tax=Neobacillus paridis TaxID=2803862 RepID=A0ABS1TR90_9BACI|nr:hypothetical protein [Neobacillus paridis]
MIGAFPAPIGALLLSIGVFPAPIGALLLSIGVLSVPIGAPKINTTKISTNLQVFHKFLYFSANKVYTIS